MQIQATPFCLSLSSAYKNCVSRCEIKRTEWKCLSGHSKKGEKWSTPKNGFPRSVSHVWVLRVCIISSNARSNDYSPILPTTLTYIKVEREKTQNCFLDILQPEGYLLSGEKRYKFPIVVAFSWPRFALIFSASVTLNKTTAGWTYFMAANVPP